MRLIHAMAQPQPQDTEEADVWRTTMPIELTQEQWDVLYTSMQIVEYYNNLTLLELTEQLLPKWVDLEPSEIDSYLERVIDSIHTLNKEHEN